MARKTTASPHIISSNTFHAPMTTSGLEWKEEGMEESRIYLEGLAVAAARAQLLDDASEINVSEVVSGPRRPQFNLRHKECARVAQRPQRGPQGRRPRRRLSLLGAVAARRGGNGARGRDGEVPSAAAKAEQVARRGEERG